MPEIDVVPAHSRWFRPLASLATAALIVVGLLVPSPAAAAPGNLPSPATATPGNLPATTTADNPRATAPSQITQVMMDGPNQAMYGGPLSYDVAVYWATAGGEVELWIDGTLREKFAFSPSQPQVIPVNNLPAGKHLISVLYPGDSVNLSSSVTRTVTVYEWSSEVVVQTPWPAPTGSLSVSVRFVPADASMSAAESTAVTVTVDPVPTPTPEPEPTPEPTPTATPEPSPTQSVVPSPTAPMVPSPPPSPAPLAATGTADAGGLLLTALLLIAGALAAARVARRQRS